MKCFINGLIFLLITAFSSTALVAETCEHKHGIFLSIKSQAPVKIRERVQAAACTIFGEEVVQDFLNDFDRIWSKTSDLSKVDNMGMYLTCRDDGSLCTDFEKIVFAVKLENGVKISETKFFEKFFGPDMRLQEFGGWIICVDRTKEELLNDSELLQKIVADVQKPMDGDVVCALREAGMRSSLKAFESATAKLSKESCVERMNPEGAMEAMRDTEEISISFRCDAENTYVKISHKIKKGSASAKELKSLPKEKGRSYAIFSVEGPVFESSFWRSVNPQYFLWLSKYFSALKEGNGEYKCDDGECCECTETADKKLQCRSNCKIADGMLASILELFFQHWTGDCYFAVAQSGDICCFVGVQEHAQTGKTLEKSLMDFPATSAITISKCEDYGAFKIYEIMIEINGITDSIPVAIGDGVAIFNYKFKNSAGEIEDLRGIIDTYCRDKITEYVPLRDGMIGEGSIDFGALIGMLDPSQGSCPVNFSYYAANDTLTFNANMKNVHILTLVDAMRKVLSHLIAIFQHHVPEKTADGGTWSYCPR